ncbi:hypothetical protein ABH908_000076 [Pseudomonas frederiksbergensis]|uniref:hypothetical protein n=1 Tax=Pseudomonas TaxID=286 RepID=UPI003D1B74B3
MSDFDDLLTVANSLESPYVLDELYLFESNRGNKSNSLHIVGTEHCKVRGTGSDTSLRYELFRARAEKSGNRLPPFDSWENSISVAVCHKTMTVRFGPVGRIQMNPEGVGIGPALMAKVINWLHESKLHSYSIAAGGLSHATVKTDEARIQRNLFYLNFGFALVGSDKYKAPAEGIEVLNGNFSAPSVGDLVVPDRYAKLLQKSADFYSVVRDERAAFVRLKHDVIGDRIWARGHTVFAPIKRFVLWMMDCPIKPPEDANTSELKRPRPGSDLPPVEEPTPTPRNVLVKAAFLTGALVISALLIALGGFVTVADAQLYYRVVDNPGCCGWVEESRLARPWTYLMVDEWTEPTWESGPGNTTEFLTSNGIVQGEIKFWRVLGERPIVKQ